MRLKHLQSAPRRGVTVILVLGLLATTLAVFYAMMRTQVSSLQVQANLNRGVEAQQAARIGMAVALRRLHEADWADAGGVETVLAGAVSNDVTYRVTFETGDPWLTPSDPDYDEYPFRLTVTSTGYAADPTNPDVQSEYQVQTVVQLVRRAFSSTPPVWESLQDYTAVSWEDNDTEIEFPARLEGPFKFGGGLKLCDRISMQNSALEEYMGDLERMRLAGLGDHRPFSGPLWLPYNRTTGELRQVLTNELGLQTYDTARGGSAPLTHPGRPQSYRLYPGGKEYEIPTIQSQSGYFLGSQPIEGDVSENPLAVFLSSGPLVLGDSATVRGTVISDGWFSDLNVAGQNVVLEAPDLPPLHGQPEEERVQLPVAIVKEDFRVWSEADATVSGFVAAFDEFYVTEGDDQTTLDLTGRVVTPRLRIRERWSWDLSNSQWNDLLKDFQRSDAAYFPKWLQENRGLEYQPKLTIRPPAAGVKFHWQDWSQPVYAVGPEDEGLVWDLVRWSEVQP